MNIRKVCVATGSSSGIGAATVRRYAREGWDVVVNYSREAAPAEAVAAECRALGAQALVVQADIARDDDCRRLAADVEARFGRCDVLVNNAGTTKFVDPRNLDGLQAEDFQRIMGVNVVGTFQMTRALLPLLKRHPVAGVVNVSSVASATGRGSSIAYSASKGAINAMTLCLARALAPEVRVNAVLPGMVETPWLQQGLGPQRYAAALQQYQATVALGAAVSADDVADAVWWLGAGAGKSTGELVWVDGGLRLPRS